MQPADRLRRLAGGDNLVAEKVRLAIMLYLSLNGRVTSKRLEKELGLTSGNLGSHLKKLEEGGYVQVRRSLLDARARIVSPTPSGLVALASFLRNITGVASEHLQAKSTEAQ